MMVVEIVILHKAAHDTIFFPNIKSILAKIRMKLNKIKRTAL